MLPYGFKLVWFALSLSGLLSCGPVIYILGRAAEVLWPLFVFGGSMVALQGIFCLGIIWRMDPYLMPKAFCFSQVVLSTVASFALMGLCLACTIATHAAVEHPKSWNAPKSALQSLPRYYLPLISLPLACSVAFIVTAFKLDAVQPTDGLNCDASHPVWVRFVGTAGLIHIFTGPCIYISIVSARRLMKIQRHLERARDPGPVFGRDDFTQLPRRHRRVRERHSLTPRRNTSSPAPSRFAIRQGSVSADAPAAPAKRKFRFHLPTIVPPVLSSARTTSTNTDTKDEWAKDQYETEAEDELRSSSPVSSAFPTFAPPPSRVTTVGHVDVEVTAAFPDEYWKEQNGQGNDSPPTEGCLSTTTSSLACGEYGPPMMGITKSEMNSDDTYAELEAELDERVEGEEEWDIVDDYEFRCGQSVTGNLESSGSSTPRDSDSRPPSRRQRQPPTDLSAAIWRLIVFQMTMSFLYIVGSISSIVDAARSPAPPKAFGTQHVSLILISWAPFMILGSVPNALDKLKFWR